jgi:hypothetical protein
MNGFRPGKMDEEGQGQKIQSDLQVGLDPADGEVGTAALFRNR